ncbi:tRNA-guanine transglycosylase DpdA [Candidatus Poriferisodalis sp.]|uniref:tRNA-guanine transglycosylase DpdA n=1 Tax=Candidatus Poriferisodalis sp. TaxID=3101277 RepID=UPI003B528734
MSRLKFYFPDSQDQIDPSFDFYSEERSPFRVRQRDDRYAHEVLCPAPYDGLLVSKPIVDGMPGVPGKYTEAQRHRLYREGVRRFFRLEQQGKNLEMMGDCGAFTYARDDQPPYSVDEVVDFYQRCRFDAGVSVDHVVFGYDPLMDTSPSAVPEEWTRRQQLTLSLAAEFLRQHRRERCDFEPIGVAHGWSPQSYAASVRQLQSIGYRRIAMGGMVPLKTHAIMAILSDVKEEIRCDTQLHLLGVTRPAYMHQFAQCGVTSFDSTSPFVQAFMDERDNYYTISGSHVAIRVPQVDGNTRLRQLVNAGEVDQRVARRLEGDCLAEIRHYAAGTSPLSAAIEAIGRYCALIGDKKDRMPQYTETLESRAWETCKCNVCRAIGVEVVLFRGAERNRRRGFHNLHVFEQRLARELSPATGQSV